MSTEDEAPRPQHTVLVIDDDAAMRRLLRLELTAAGYAVLEAANGAEGLRLAAEQLPDAVLLDLSLPDMSGLDVLVELKRRPEICVVLFSQWADEDVRLDALTRGADDVLTKGISLDQLTSTLATLLSHGKEGLQQFVIQAGKAEIDVRRQEVRVADQLIALSRTEWQLLQHLAEYAGRPRLHQELLSAVWGPDYRDDIRYLRLWIDRLKRKLGDNEGGPQAIREYLNVGYALNAGSATPASGF